MIRHVIVLRGESSVSSMVSKERSFGDLRVAKVGVP